MPPPWLRDSLRSTVLGRPDTEVRAPQTTCLSAAAEAQPGTRRFPMPPGPPPCLGGTWAPPRPACACSRSGTGRRPAPLPGPAARVGLPEPARQWSCSPDAHPVLGARLRAYPVGPRVSRSPSAPPPVPSARAARPPTSVSGAAYRAPEAAAALRDPGGSGRPGRARRRERSRLLPAAPAPAPGACSCCECTGCPIATSVLRRKSNGRL